MTRALLLAVAITYALLLFINWPHLADPLIRHDDYPAFFGDEHHFYPKTLSEGRWLNYWWMARDTMWPAWLAFQFYTLAWAIFSAAAALIAFGHHPEQRLYAILAAILIAISPQAYLIAGWYNTLGMGIWVVALFALIAYYGSARAARWAFLVLGPISMLAYTTYPLLMAALIFVRKDMRRSLGDAVLLTVLVGLSIIGGMLLMYSINFYHYGIFGLEVAEWRGPSPATDLQSLLANLDVVINFLSLIYPAHGIGMEGFGIFVTLLLAAALAVVIRTSRAEGLYLLLGFAIALGVLLVNGLKEGVDLPVRASIGSWVFLALGLARATQILAEQSKSRVVPLATAMFAALYSGHLLKNTHMLVPWLTESRAFADSLPQDIEGFQVYGHVRAFPGAHEANITHYYGFTARIRQVAGLNGLYCDSPFDTCYIEPPFDPNDTTAQIHLQRRDGMLFIRMPTLPAGVRLLEMAPTEGVHTAQADNLTGQSSD